MYGKMMGGKAKETASKGKKKGVPVTIMVAVGKPKMPMPTRHCLTPSRLYSSDRSGWPQK
jgi:hypothetical protein